MANGCEVVEVGEVVCKRMACRWDTRSSKETDWEDVGVEVSPWPGWS